MFVQSKFRKLFLLKIVMGFCVFIAILFSCLKYLILNPINFKDPYFIASSVFLLFLILTASDLFKIYTITVTDKGIVKTIFITKSKINFAFDDLVTINREKITAKITRGGQISDGFHFSIINFKNNQSLIISPDDFENYGELMLAIKNNSKNKNL